ncbi:MAG: hypothetical protein RIT27_1855 [Pseudomonadota bacterium]|jgi:holin-like protein
MLGSLALLLLFQLIGEILTKALLLPIPGPVLGMLLLFLMLLVRGQLSPSLQTTSQTLLSHLSLFFVPAGVGVILHITLLKNEWFIILMVLILSTLITMLISAVVMQYFVKHFSSQHDKSQ